jgi:hypothetical protein
MSVSECSLSRAIRRLGLTLKKKTIGAAECDEAEREACREVIRSLPVEKGVVVTNLGAVVA